MILISKRFHSCIILLDEKNKWGIRLYVCNYGTGGNTSGKPIFTSGKPCSKCPSGTTCKEGLCSKAKRDNETPEETFSKN